MFVIRNGFVLKTKQTKNEEALKKKKKFKPSQLSLNLYPCVIIIIIIIVIPSLSLALSLQYVIDRDIFTLLSLSFISLK